MATTETPITVSPEASWWPDSGRATHAVIDLDAIAGNVRAIRRTIGAASIIAVVKANAYGHGAVMVAEAAVSAGATMLAVSAVDEGLELREAGITAGLLVLAPAAPAEYEDAFRAGLTLTIAEVDQVTEAARVARTVGTPGALQLKVETGMNRYGCDPSQAINLATRIQRDPWLRLTGTFTHLADADSSDLNFTRRQVERFETVIGDLTAAGIDPGLVHHSNTAGTLRLAATLQSAVRLGIGLYGLRPDDAVPLLPGMRQALTLRTRVAQVRRLNTGDTVSYGRTYVAGAPEMVALLPIGYADGLRRAMSGSGWVGINGRRAPIRGRVCMDQTIVGCPDESIRAGDPVVVFGDGGEEAPGFIDVARITSTISYEIATGIAHRVPRWYLRAGRPVATLRGSRLQRF